MRTNVLAGAEQLARCVLGQQVQSLLRFVGMGRSRRNEASAAVGPLLYEGDGDQSQRKMGNQEEWGTIGDIEGRHRSLIVCCSLMELGTEGQRSAPAIGLLSSESSFGVFEEMVNVVGDKVRCIRQMDDDWMERRLQDPSHYSSSQIYSKAGAEVQRRKLTNGHRQGPTATERLGELPHISEEERGISTSGSTYLRSTPSFPFTNLLCQTSRATCCGAMP